MGKLIMRRARTGFGVRGVTAALAILFAIFSIPSVSRGASYEGERILTLDDIVPVPTPPPAVTASPSGQEDGITDGSVVDGDDAALQSEAQSLENEEVDGLESEDTLDAADAVTENSVVSTPDVVTAPVPEMFDAPVTSGDVIYDPTIYIYDENGNLVPMPGQGGIDISSGAGTYSYGDATIIPEASELYYQGSRVPPVGPTYYYDASPMYYYGPYGPYGMWGPSVGWGFWSRPNYHRPPQRPRPPSVRPPPGRPPRPPGMGRPPSGRPPGSRPPGGRPPGVRPPGGRPPGGRPPGIRPPGGRPPGGRPPGGRPSGGRPGGQRPPRPR